MVPLSRLAPDLAMSSLNILDGQVKWVEGSQIAEGGYGIIYKGTWDRIGGKNEVVAVKRLKLDSSAEGLEAFSEFRHEAALMAYVFLAHSRHVISLAASIQPKV